MTKTNSLLCPLLQINKPHTAQSTKRMQSEKL